MIERPLVVVPVDASDGGVTSAYAVALAERREADVDLLQVVRRRSSTITPAAPIPATATAAHDRVRLRQVTQKGEPAKVIGAYAQLVTAAVIVVGKYYGSSRWRRTTAVVSRLGRSAPVPVLIVPPHDPGEGPLRAGPFVNIVSAVDFTVSSAVALRTALDLARTSRGRVTMVHVLRNISGRMVFSGSEAFGVIGEAQAEAVAVAARLRREIPADAASHVDSRVTTGDPRRGILDVATRLHADLIVMGVPPRGRADEVLFGSTLRGVLRQATIPVLVLPVAAGAHEWIVGVRR